MSAERTAQRLLRAYPPAWRARYGEELAALIVETSEGGRVRWRTRLDVAGGAARERLRASGLGDAGSPAERARAGVLLVLCAFALFVAAGCVLAKRAEHWQAAGPAPALPVGAFDVLVGAALLAGVLVAAGVALALPALVRWVRAGGLADVSAHVGLTALFGAAAVLATVGLVAWAGTLGPAARDGADRAYAVAFVVWALLVLQAGAACTVTAVAIARRLRLGAVVRVAHALLACGVSLAMVLAAACAAAWWASAPAVAADSLVAIVVMGAAAALAAGGARHATGSLLRG